MRDPISPLHRRIDQRVHRRRQQLAVGGKALHHAQPVAQLHNRHLRPRGHGVQIAQRLRLLVLHLVRGRHQSLRQSRRQIVKHQHIHRAAGRGRRLRIGVNVGRQLPRSNLGRRPLRAELLKALQWLLLAIFLHCEIAAGQTMHGVALRVRHRHIHNCFAGVDLQGGGRRGGRVLACAWRRRGEDRSTREEDQLAETHGGFSRCFAGWADCFLLG